MNKKLPLMLDSTVLKQVPKLNSGLFVELIKHIRAGLYDLFLSEVIEQEFISWIKTEAQNAFDAVTKATNSLNKYHEEPCIFGFGLNITSNVAENQINGILNKAVENWELFKEQTGATVIPIHRNHGKLVMEAYFSGDIPFSKIKNRSDIPDAFIYRTLIDLVDSKDKVVFVTSDKKFSHLIQNENIICFESLSDLLKNGPLKLDSSFFELLTQKDRVQTLVNIYEQEIFKKIVREVEMSDFTEDFEERQIDIAVGEYEDINTTVKSLEVNYKEMVSISEHTFIVPFKVKINCKVESLASKDELNFFNESRLNKIDKEVDENGDFKVFESTIYSGTGNFSLVFEDTDPSTWKAKKTQELVWNRNEVTQIKVDLEDIRIS